MNFNSTNKKNGIPDDLWQKIIHSEETKTKKRN